MTYLRRHALLYFSFPFISYLNYAMFVEVCVPITLCGAVDPFQLLTTVLIKPITSSEV